MKNIKQLCSIMKKGYANPGTKWPKNKGGNKK